MVMAIVVINFWILFVNSWKLIVLADKSLGLQNICQLQFRIKLATDLLLTPDEEEPRIQGENLVAIWEWMVCHMLQYIIML